LRYLVRCRFAGGIGMSKWATEFCVMMKSVLKNVVRI